MHCPKLAEGGLQKTENITPIELREAWEAKATVMPPKINRIALAHDRSCNISCPSCRTKLIIAGRAETTHLDQLTDKSLLPLILASNRVSITGSGDPFSSKHYRNVIRRLTALPPGPIIDLQTNGLLLARAWTELGLEGRVGNVLVSIDAATKETYEVIRRGGVFEDLMENLEYLSALRKRGGVASVRLDFVTQALNFREMPEAADMMRGFGFDEIKFQMLRSWNTWSPEEFRKQHVGHPGHPDHKALQNVMLDPRLAQSDVMLSGFYSISPGKSPASSSSDAKSTPNSERSNGEARHVSSLE
jgi:sulfatase maturation enzyme AslB (radical SAM superfamily)